MAIPTNLRGSPPHPVYRVELAEAAENHGFRRENGIADGWLFFRSDEDVPGEVALASGLAEDGAPWFLAVEHAGVAARLRAEYPDAEAGPPPGRFHGALAFATQHEMRRALSRAFNLARSLPTFPLAQFEAEVAELGATETDRIVRQRIGQAYFRNALLDYWDNRCPLTQIREPALLRASHIVPWAECTSNAQRLDVHNGLLLAAHWDAAFDKGLVSFDNDGRALIKPDLDPAVFALLAPDKAIALPLDPKHLAPLSWHRAHFGF